MGRLDPKAHRKEKRLEIKEIFLEKDVEINDVLVSELKTCLDKFSQWHEMETLEITDADPPELLEALQ